MGKIVIKTGLKLIRKNLEEIASSIKNGDNFIVVHGGGEYIDRQLRKQKIEPVFIAGYRYTDKKTLGIVRRALSKINKKLVTLFKKFNIKAKGIEAKEFLTCRQITELGYVGNPIQMNTRFLYKLFKEGVTPIISPIGKDKKGRILNINADDVAGHIAACIKSEKLIFLIDKLGVLDKNKKLIKKIKIKHIDKIIDNGTVTGGMIPKLINAKHAIINKVKEVIIKSENSSLFDLTGTKIIE